MHSQLFSNKTRAFYPVKSLRYYKSVGSLPDDLVRISDAECQEFYGAAPSNTVPNFNSQSKKMEWLAVEPAAKSEEEIKAENQSELKARQQQAAISAFQLQAAVSMGIATEEEEQRLAELQEYAVALLRVDLVAPDWPLAPEWLL